MLFWQLSLNLEAKSSCAFKGYKPIICLFLRQHGKRTLASRTTGKSHQDCFQVFPDSIFIITKKIFGISRISNFRCFFFNFEKKSGKLFQLIQ
jgi:hypothetical protein